MIKEDLEYIFKNQIAAGETKLYFMLVDGEHKTVGRHPVETMEELIPMLGCFEYQGNANLMPRFAK